MDSVVFDGVEYVRAAVAAKQLKYTQDYVGQLCRAKKVDARLVGRTWFVNINSITEHVSGRYKKRAEETTPTSTDVTSNIKPERKSLPIEPRRAPVIVSSTTTKLPVRDLRTLEVSYEPDDESLMPTIRKKVLPPPARLPVDPADARQVQVSADKRSTVVISYRPTPMPEIALRGDIFVADIPEEDHDAENKQNGKSTLLPQPERELSEIPPKPTEKIVHSVLKNKEISDRPVDVSVAQIRDNHSSRTVHIRKPALVHLEVVQEEGVSVNSSLSERVSITTLPATSSVVTVPPKSEHVGKVVVDATPVRSDKIEVVSSLPFVPQVTVASVPPQLHGVAVLVPVLIVLLALACGLLIIATGTLASSSEQGYEARFIFEFSNLITRLGW